MTMSVYDIELKGDVFRFWKGRATIVPGQWQEHLNKETKYGCGVLGMICKVMVEEKVTDQAASMAKSFLSPRVILIKSRKLLQRVF